MLQNKRTELNFKGAISRLAPSGGLLETINKDYLVKKTILNYAVQILQNKPFSNSARRGCSGLSSTPPSPTCSICGSTLEQLTPMWLAHHLLLPLAGEVTTGSHAVMPHPH